ncbi:hypothetical protein BC659_2906 [Sediminibacterium goheungense]|uniref:Uncharacterized protein n=1 Tax=Sediminibacterium goheungense TaxID=1086393 RepID=A0A4R6IU00_9BACT|nr:hypothetical protein BC659_2906 [Sediminibacterium goheungense]
MYRLVQVICALVALQFASFRIVLIFNLQLPLYEEMDSTVCLPVYIQ